MPPEATTRTGAEQAAPAEPSDLALLLGGQTGSEMVLPEPPACEARTTDYALADLTPLGFAAEAIALSITAQSYRVIGLGAEAGADAAELRMELNAPALFIDRTPAEDSSCLDALLIRANFDIAARGESLLTQVTLHVYAAAVDRFAARASIPFADLPRALADAALESEVTVFLESLEGGAQFWFYRGDGDRPSDLLGRLVPIPRSR